jgi:hypothetical protein
MNSLAPQGTPRISSQKGVPFDPANPERYLREHFSYIDQFYCRFEAEFDASVFSDPTALQTKWTTSAFKVSSTNYGSFTEAGAGRVEFCGTSGMKLVALFIILAGLGAAVANVAAGHSGGKLAGVLLLSASFVVAGLVMLRQCGRAIVFDKGRGLFWTGGDEPPASIRGRGKAPVRLSSIRAVQLIFWGALPTAGVTPRHEDRCELNLVLDGGQRVHVVLAYYAGHDRLRADAAALSRFLGCPLWDAIDTTRALFEKMRGDAAFAAYFGPPSDSKAR